jgi:hypothetical protein
MPADQKSRRARNCRGFLTHLHFARLIAFGDGSSLVPGKGFVTHGNSSPGIKDRVKRTTRSLVCARVTPTGVRRGAAPASTRGRMGDGTRAKTNRGESSSRDPRFRSTYHPAFEAVNARLAVIAALFAPGVYPCILAPKSLLLTAKRYDKLHYCAWDFETK